MFELQKEKTIMYSDDRTVELTNCRVIHHAAKNKSQIMLEDFVNYQLRKAHIGNYRAITIVFASISVIVWTMEARQYFDDKETVYAGLSFFDFFIRNGLLWFSSVLLAISLFFLTISRRHLVQINGKFNSIEFRVTSFRKRSVKKFLQTLIDQSKLSKEEKQKSL